MHGKQLIEAAFLHQETQRTPWVPFAGVHAGKLKGYTATEVLTDADKLYRSLLEVHRLYMPDGMPICFDLQLEAEILGCELLWVDDNPPSVRTHPLENSDEIPTMSLQRDDGRIPIVMEAARRMKASVGKETALYGLFCGPFTLASHLRGTALFKGMKRNPDYIKSLISYCTDIGIQMADFYAECDMDIIVPVDPLVSQISPEHFTEFLTGPYTRIFEHIRSTGKFSSFFVCGNALRNIDVMCKTNPDGISVDENIPIATAKAITDPYNICIGGNIPLTTVMLFGNQQDNIKFVVDMIDRLDDTHNFIVSPGCDMPYNTPIENTIAVAETVRDLNKYRELIKNYESTGLDDIDVVLPDYENLKKPLLECFTLDSASCAACTYMWAVTCDAKERYKDAIDIMEYKYTRLEDIARIKKVGVQNLPSLYINGKLAYASIIPNQEELFAKIDALI